MNLNKNSLILEKKNLEQKPKNKQTQRSEKIANTYQRRKKRETKENLFVPKADRPNKKEINNFTIDDVLRKISEFKQIRSELVNKMANINKTKEEFAKEIKSMGATLANLQRQYEKLNRKPEGIEHEDNGTNNPTTSKKNKAQTKKKNSVTHKSQSVEPYTNNINVHTLTSSNINVNSQAWAHPNETMAYTAQYASYRANISTLDINK